MNTPSVLNELQPGDVITFSSTGDLPEFEDWVAREIDPTMTDDEYAAWMGRVPLKSLIRPPKYNGNISDIRLRVMDHPYDQLFTANTRGWHFPHGEGRGKPNNRSENSDTINGFVGFVLVAHLSGARFSGELVTELWYGPVASIHHRNGRTYKSTSVHGGQSVQRYVAEPHAEMAGYEVAQAESQAIAWELLRDRLAYPITIGMHN